MASACPAYPDGGSAWSLHTPQYRAPATLSSGLLRLFLESSSQEIAKRTWYTPLALGQIGASITTLMARFGCRNDFTPVANGRQDQMLTQKFHAVAPMSACFPSVEFHHTYTWNFVDDPARFAPPACLEHLRTLKP